VKKRRSQGKGRRIVLAKNNVLAVENFIEEGTSPISPGGGGKPANDQTGGGAMASKTKGEKLIMLLKSKKVFRTSVCEGEEELTQR